VPVPSKHAEAAKKPVKKEADDDEDRQPKVKKHKKDKESVRQ